MKINTQNHLLPKLAKSTTLMLCVLTLFFVCSCKKEIKEEKETNTLPSSRIDETSAFKELLSISGLNESLKTAFDESYCKYSQNQDGNKLWVVALKKGSLSFTKAKAFISLKKKELFVLVLSYEYDRGSYKQGDFGTYTGTISFYDGNINKIKDLIYEKGNLKQIIPANCPTCVLCGNCPPPAAVDWCVSYPMLCGSNNGSNDPGEWQNMQPGDGGGGGSGTTYSATVSYLISTLSLPEAQANWLANNPARADEMYNYLNNSNSSVTFDEKKQIAYDHLFNMMSDASYLAFVVNHSQTSTNVIVWWEDDTWLDNPNNFNLDLDPDENNEYGELTAAEKALVKAHPQAAAAIWFNKSIAENQTVAKMGANGLNDQSDAFRHCFFQAINTMAVGASLTQHFSDAHESEVPTQLQLEKQMDLFNNSVGIAYGQSLSFWTSVSELADGVRGKVFNGELKYLKPINYSDPNFWGTSPSNATHGITSSTALTPTNQ